MTEKDKEINELRREVKKLTELLDDLLTRVLAFANEMLEVFDGDKTED